MFKKLSAYKTYLIFSGATSLFFSLVFTVNMVYQIEKIGLNPLQLILVGTTLESACFIFEIPTGIVADIYSRKLSVIIGVTMIGLGFVLEGTVPVFIAMIGAQVLWGVGYTFISGAFEAWIAEEEKEMELNQIYLRGSQAGQIGSIIGIILSTILGNFSLQLPIILGGVQFILLAVFLALFMPENNFSSAAPGDLNTFQKMGHTFKNGLTFIKSKPIFMVLLGITLFYGLSSEGYDRLSSAHFLKDISLPKLWNLQSVTWFGIFGILGMVMSAVTMQFIIKKLEKNNKLNSAGILLTTNVFYIVFMLIFALAGNFTLGLIAYLSTNMFRTIKNPIYDAWLNSHIEGNARATVLSTNGQIDALGQILGGPIIGIIATKVSISVGIACTALLLSPVIVLYLFSIVSDKNTKITY